MNEIKQKIIKELDLKQQTLLDDGLPLELLRELQALLIDGVVPNHNGNKREREAATLAWGISAQEAVYRATHRGEDHSKRLLS